MSLTEWAVCVDVPIVQTYFTTKIMLFYKNNKIWFYVFFIVVADSTQLKDKRHCFVFSQFCVEMHKRVGHTCTVCVCLHNGSWWVCAAGLRSWETLAALRPSCICLVFYARLQPFSTAPAACNFKAEENKDSWELLNNTWRTVLNSGPHTVRGIRRKYLWFPLLLFSTSYLSSTAFPPKIPTRVLSQLAASLIVIVQSFFCCFFQTVTKKKFGSSDFRSALESGVLLCE